MQNKKRAGGINEKSSAVPAPFLEPINDKVKDEKNKIMKKFLSYVLIFFQSNLYKIAKGTIHNREKLKFFKNISKAKPFLYSNSDII